MNQKIYRAKAGLLPAEFHDGTRQTGPSDCAAKIYRRQKGPQVHIEIKICYISTTIIIRQVGEFLTFHVKTMEIFQVIHVNIGGNTVNVSKQRDKLM